MERADSVVIDTSAFYALVSQEDQFHEEAHLVFQTLVTEERALFTTSYVLVEAQALISRRFGFVTAQAWMRSITDTVEIVWVAREQHDAAWRGFEERGGTGLSFVDWTVLLEAQRLNATIFTFDSDFILAGADVTPQRAR